MTGARSRSLSGLLRLLVDDGWLLLSWFVFIGSGLYSVYVMSGHFGAQLTSYSTKQIWQCSLFAAYWAWAMYWGVPGCLGFLNRGLQRILGYGFSPSTIVALFLYVCFAMIVLLNYPPLGGGVVHFLQRWINAARNLPAPSVTTPAPRAAMLTPPMGQLPSPDVERRLQALADLLQRGLITQQEHDQQRTYILRSL